MEEEPPEGCGVVDGGAVGIGCDNGSYDAVCRLVKEDLLRERRKWHHVVRKSGGLWS